ncbi:MAG: hypothetical protein GX900_03900, partial [Clostridiaceae bacterium]|nr:hypothetical protein [Clostridiaceae bacterium]
GNIWIYHIGLGLGFRFNEEGQSFIKFKAEFGFEKSVEIAIVYLKGYVYAGIDGAYHFGELGKGIELEIYLKGGLEGGIIALGKRYNIISFMLDARCKLESLPPQNKWKVSGSVKVSYSLNLFLFSVSGSVRVGFNKTL